MSASRPSVSAFRLAAQALGALPAGADEVLSSALPPLDAPLPLADASPFDALPAVDPARAVDGRTPAPGSAAPRSTLTPEPPRPIQASRAQPMAVETDGRRVDADRAPAFPLRRTGAASPATRPVSRPADGSGADRASVDAQRLASGMHSAADPADHGSRYGLKAGVEADASRVAGQRLGRGVNDAIRRGEAGSTPHSGAVAAFRQAGRALAAMPRGLEGLFAAESALSALAPELPSLAAAAFAGIGEDALPSPRPTSAAGHERRDGRPARDPAPPARSPRPVTAPPAPHSAPRVAADPVAPRPTAAPILQDAASADVRPVHRLAPRDGVRAAPAARPRPEAVRQDGTTSTAAARSASTPPAAPGKRDRMASAPATQDRVEPGGVASTASADIPRGTAAGDGQADALSAALRRVDVLARRVMAAEGRAVRAETPAEHARGAAGSSLAGSTPAPRIHAPAPRPDPFAAWDAAVHQDGGPRAESTALSHSRTLALSHPAGPAPEPASGNPFAALLAPSPPVTAQGQPAAPDLAPHALTHSRTSALPHFPAWDDDAADATLDPAILADLVNDALVEQARLHGVDLS